MAAALLALFGGSANHAQSDPPPGQWVNHDALAAAETFSEGWLSHGRTYSEQRHSPLGEINAANVATLGTAWSFTTGTRRGLEATPIVVDGVLFATGTWSVVYALDAKTGNELWRFDPEVDRSYGMKACCDVVNRGVAVHGGKVFSGVLDGRLVALDAATGRKAWETVTVDQSLSYTITGAPRIVKGKVIIGNGGAEYGVRGYISAYDIETGALVWRTFTVPGNPAEPFESEAMQRAAKTWSGGPWWEIGGGGTVWDSMAFDPELDLLYVGTGNGSPWNRHVRSPGGGDNLYLSSILALDPDDGRLVWHYQTTPGDSWDYTATQHIVLADLEIGGELRKVAMQAPKNGFFYVLDRKTGALLSAENYVPVSWAEKVDLKTGRPVETPTADYKDSPQLVRPSALGGHNWQPMSFHPGTRLVYIPAQEKTAAYAHNTDFRYQPGAWNTGTLPDLRLAIEAMDRPVKAYLLAWDPVAQEERWRVEHPDYWNGGVLSTGGDLVFQGRSDGFFLAYRASDGKELWRSWLGTGIIAAPITYALDGEQFVTVLAGWGGAYGQARPDPAASGVAEPGRIVTFKLGGRTVLTEANPAKPALAAPEPLENIPVNASAADLAAGENLYRTWCANCHRAIGNGGGAIPDLRRSTKPTFDAYPTIVLAGKLQPKGMPAFRKWLDETQVAQIRAYVLDLRHQLNSTAQPN